MITVANDLSSRRHGSDLSHFGERGQNLYTSSTMHISSRNSFDHDAVYCMPVEKNFESDRGMNCLDILAGVVSRCSSSEIEQNPSKCAIIASGLDDFCRIISERDDSPGTQEHRVSCHRCGNIRKRKIVCVRPQCPHIFCGRCADKMKAEHGIDAFLRGCPVCQELCCCVNKTVYCSRKNHCYRKCPASKCADPAVKSSTQSWEYDNAGLAPQHNDTLSLLPISDIISTLDGTVADDSRTPNDASEVYYLPLNKISISNNGPLDFLAAAVSIMDRNDSHSFSAAGCVSKEYRDGPSKLPLSSSEPDLVETVRKRTREGRSTSSENISNSDSIDLRADSHEAVSDAPIENSKLVKTGSHSSSNELQPAPSYFLAHKLPIPEMKKQPPSENADSNRIEQNTWLKNLKISTGQEQYGRSQVRPPPQSQSQGPVNNSLPHPHRSSQLNFIPESTTPVHRMNGDFFGLNENSNNNNNSKSNNDNNNNNNNYNNNNADKNNDNNNNSNDRKSIPNDHRNASGSMKYCLSVQSTRDEDSITRKTVSGTNTQALIPYFKFPTSSNKFSLYPFLHSSSAPSLFKSTENVCSHPLPPPL